MGLTNQEAIKIIKANYPTPNYSELCEAVDIALDLLQKQEPMEPHWRCPTVYMNGTGKIELICGNCGISIPLGKPSYCPWCGRAVKWDARQREAN